MKKIVRTTYPELLEIILNMEEDDEPVEFALSANVGNPTKYHECENWHFAKRFNVEEYDSRFIIIDEHGGANAFALPLNNYQAGPDSDDYDVAAERMSEFLKGYGLNFMTDRVFVNRQLKTFVYNVEQTISTTVEIEALTEDEASEKLENMLNCNEVEFEKNFDSIDYDWSFLYEN